MCEALCPSSRSTRDTSASSCACPAGRHRCLPRRALPRGFKAQPGSREEMRVATTEPPGPCVTSGAPSGWDRLPHSAVPSGHREFRDGKMLSAEYSWAFRNINADTVIDRPPSSQDVNTSCFLSHHKKVAHYGWEYKKNTLKINPKWGNCLCMSNRWLIKLRTRVLFGVPTLKERPLRQPR